MEGLSQALAAYLRQAWPPFVVGAVLGLIVGLIL